MYFVYYIKDNMFILAFNSIQVIGERRVCEREGSLIANFYFIFPCLAGKILPVQNKSTVINQTLNKTIIKGIN